MHTSATAFESARPKLLGLAYRMLGSRADAEDVLQDAWIKWHQADTAEVHDPDAWLVTVVTRLGIDRQRQLRSRREDYVGPWLPEPVLGDTAPGADRLTELASDLSLAFLVALERLGAEERAAFLLREVFEYSYAEIASVLGKHTATCRQIVTRARARIREERPRFRVNAEIHRAVVAKFVEALMRGDRDAFVDLLAEEVVWVADGGGRTTAASKAVRGFRAVSRLAAGLARAYQKQWQVVMAPVNGEAGVVIRSAGRIRAVLALETDGRCIHRIHAVVNPDKLR